MYPTHIRYGKQWEPSVKTLRFPLSTECFEALCVEWRNSTPGFCLVAIAKQMKILITYSSFPRVGIEPTTTALQAPLCPCATTTSIISLSEHLVVTKYFAQIYEMISVAANGIWLSQLPLSMYFLLNLKCLINILTVT